MKSLFAIFSLTFSLLMTWGCKKDSIVDDIPSQSTIDSLAWNDSIGGRYMMYGIKSGYRMEPDTTTPGNFYPFYYSDTIESILNIIHDNDLIITISFEGTGNYGDLNITSVDTIRSHYKTNGTNPTFSPIDITFINNSVDSIYYLQTYTGHASSSQTKLAGVRIP